MSTLWHELRARTLAGDSPEDWETYLERIGPVCTAPLSAMTIGAAAPRHAWRSVIKIPIPPAIRWEVWERDDFTCQHCGVRRHLTIDHIYPESRGGPIHADNLQTLCKSCNSAKGAR